MITTRSLEGGILVYQGNSFVESMEEFLSQPIVNISAHLPARCVAPPTLAGIVLGHHEATMHSG